MGISVIGGTAATSGAEFFRYVDGYAHIAKTLTPGFYFFSAYHNDSSAGHAYTLQFFNSSNALIATLSLTDRDASVEANVFSGSVLLPAAASYFKLADALASNGALFVERGGDISLVAEIVKLSTTGSITTTKAYTAHVFGGGGAGGQGGSGIGSGGGGSGYYSTGALPIGTYSYTIGAGGVGGGTVGPSGGTSSIHTISALGGSGGSGATGTQVGGAGGSGGGGGTTSAAFTLGGTNGANGENGVVSGGVGSGVAANIILPGSAAGSGRGAAGGFYAGGNSGASTPTGGGGAGIANTAAGGGGGSWGVGGSGGSGVIFLIGA
jgi:hypothetical protein